MDSKDFKIKDYSFTGHSLGGALAQYMAAVKDKGATTFATARAYRLLPPDIQDLVDAGYYASKIIDYRHEWDPVGHVPFGKVIGSQYIARTSSANIPLLGHTKTSFKGMFREGLVQIMYDPEGIRQIAGELMELHAQATDLQLAFRQYINFELDEVDRFVGNVKSSSEFDELEQHEIEDILYELFTHKLAGGYSVHDSSVGNDIDLFARVIKEKIYQLSTQLTAVAVKAEQTDSKLAKEMDGTRMNWFSSIDVTAHSMKQPVGGPKPERQ